MTKSLLFFWPLAVLIALFSGPACEDDSSTSGTLEPMRAEKLTTFTAEDRDPTEDDFVKASIRIGCISKRVRDREQLQKAMDEIYKRNHFKSAQQYAEMAGRLTRNRKISERILTGIRNCVKRK
ncbi:MAG: hypothetical protein JXR96_10660 [Deltaproteobacteria bacterium]|nr:hypothetical protein [Deltaproteobacteria bacterium]